MTADLLLTEVDRLGIRLSARGDQLHVEAPVGRLTPELKEQLARRKAELLDRLQPPALVCLRGGLAVPVPALLLALDLERRGFALGLDDRQQVSIGPTDASGPLTPVDAAAIARWRSHLGAIVGYRVPVVG